MNVTIISFVVSLIVITSAGAMSVIRKKKTTEDYLVASRSVKPWLTALSTVATNNSGFMFIGMIAYTYRNGIDAIWLMVGWVAGDFISWLFIHPRVRKLSSACKVNTIPMLMGTWEKTTKRAIIVAGGIITFLFLGVYAAAQLKAGSTALHALFGWEMYIGVLIGTGIVILYSYAGGIRADIWTDAAQSFAMIGAMVMILVVGWIDVGGPQALMANLEGQEAQLVGLYPEDLQFTALAFILGYLFAGFSTVGQPHIMTRLLAIKSVEAIKRARVYYFLWYGPFFLASIGVGLYCRAIIPEIGSLPVAEGMDRPTELALPLITMELLPEVFVGIALAGLFAATVSTADSQIIVCSGTLTHEVFPRWKDSYIAQKLGTFTVTALAVSIALFAPEGVFGLVLIAWSALGATLGPVLAIRVFQLPLGTGTALAMMAAGLATVVAWHFSPFNASVYKVFPGVVAAFAVYGIAWLSVLRSRQGAGEPAE